MIDAGLAIVGLESCIDGDDEALSGLQAQPLQQRNLACDGVFGAHVR